VTDSELASARAVYDASAEWYARVVGTDVSTAFEGPLDQACLRAFAELVDVGIGAGLVADIGCGPGRVAARLAARGLDAIGVDMSGAMLTAARLAHPKVALAQGHLAALPLRDSALAGAVCWYSIIHTPPAGLGAVFTELRRVLADGGQLLVAFQAGAGDAVHRTDAYSTSMTLTSFRHRLDDVVRSLVGAGLNVRARVVREPELEHESTPQAFVFAHRAARKAPSSSS
jgi:ubiquinone/menaquinone biosynthesis C-methylase UbiE